MPRLLQLNATANWGSTGRIAEEIGVRAMRKGWNSTIAYGRYMNPSKSDLIRVGNRMDVYAHYARARFLDGEGLGSRSATKRFVRQIDALAPDIIQLHNIHDHWLNYPLLFDYLATTSVPVVWTFHDCWAMTGGCAHFVLSGCEQWKTECRRCPFARHGLRKEARNHRTHIEKFAQLGDRLTIVSVSEWLDGVVAQSRLGSLRHIHIPNGVDTSVFYPRDPGKLLSRMGLEGKKIILGVSSVWPNYKGLDDFIALSRMLDDSYRIVLVGIPRSLHQGLPANVVPVERTQNVGMLAEFYSAATAVVSLSRAETFGLTLAEGLACGAPAVGWHTTGLAELFRPATGIAVEPGDIRGVKNAVERIAANPDLLPRDRCRSYAVQNFNSENVFNSYIDLYGSLLAEQSNIKL